MRRVAFFLLAAALVACAKPDTQDADTLAVTMPPPAPALSLADLAGKWTMTAMAEASDSVLLTYELNATADTLGWSMTLPGAMVVPVHVGSVAGDSVVVHAGPYDSVLRKGTKVSTEGVYRLQNGRLVGTTTARYTTSQADSVVRLRTEGTRAP